MASVPSPGCGKTSTITNFGTVPNEGSTKGTGQGGYVTIQSGGQSRGFAMRLPDNYDNSKPYWLIFAYHWNGGTGGDIDSGGTNGYWWAYYGLQRKSKNGAIFVAPDSIGAGWNSDVDIPFTDAMVKLITENYCVDMSNIITTGFSWGGGMSYSLATRRAVASTAGYAFRAAVIYEGGAIPGTNPDGSSTAPMAIWQKEGITDGTVGLGAATPVRDQFRKNNGCTGWTSDAVPAPNAKPSQMSTKVTDEPPQPPNPGQYIDPGGHICTNYTGCSAGHPIRWCVDQSGHGPGAIDGSSSLYNECANPGKGCSASCPCTWTPDDVWTWLNDPSSNVYTRNATTPN